METKVLNIPNISCNHCIMSVKREGAAVGGVEFLSGDAADKTATFRVKDDAALAELERALAEAGYPVATVQEA